MLARTLAVGCAMGIAALAASSSSPVSFHKDVLPVLQKRCQGCHRPGEAAPMSLLTYEQARPWAKSIREAVLLKRMPPWFADPHHGKFANDRSLSQRDIDTLVAWADAGAREGDPAEAPPPLEFVEGWNIGRPDLVLEMPNEFDVPASGTVEYQYVVIPTKFDHDVWLERAEVRPGNRAVVHHVIAFTRPPGSSWMRDAQPGVPFVPKKEQRGRAGTAETADSNRDSSRDATRELVVGYAPGLPPQVLEPGTGRLVKAGSNIVLQMHYTPSGKPERDRTRIGLVFAKQTPVRRISTNGAMNTKFVIPPGDPAYRVESQITLQRDSLLTALMPHMHLRGKDFEYRVVFPSGETRTLLSVPKYDFNWQIWYYLAEPLPLPKGTRIECTAHFDNSANKVGNPDPTAEVKWGDQSWEEMMIGWFDVTIEHDADPAELYRTKKPAGVSE